MTNGDRRGDESGWLDVAEIKRFSRDFSAHFVGSILAVLSFWAVAEFASRLLREGWAHDAIKTIEEFVLVGVVIWLAARLAVRLWNRREHVDSDEN